MVVPSEMQGAQVSKAMMTRQKEKESYHEIITCFANTDHVAIPKGIVSLSFHSLHVHKYA